MARLGGHRYNVCRQNFTEIISQVCVPIIVSVKYPGSARIYFSSWRKHLL